MDNTLNKSKLKLWEVRLSDCQVMDLVIYFDFRIKDCLSQISYKTASDLSARWFCGVNAAS